MKFVSSTKLLSYLIVVATTLKIVLKAATSGRYVWLPSYLKAALATTLNIVLCSRNAATSVRNLRSI